MSSLTLTFLGTGTSVGVPMVACDCAVCLSDDPRNKRLRASLFVETSEVRFVIDTGPDFRTQCLREGLTDLDAAVYTHQHSDHIMGFDDLRRFCRGKDVRIPVYALEETLERLQMAFSYAFDTSNWYPVYVKPEVNVVDGPFDLGNVQLTPLEVTHGKVRTVGYLMEGDSYRVAYVPDVKTFSNEALSQMQNLDCLILDATVHRDLRTHLSVAEAIAISEELQPKETWFTHMSHEIDHESDEAKLPKNMKFAYDGLKLSFV